MTRVVPEGDCSSYTKYFQRTTLQPQNCIVSQYGLLLDNGPLGDILKQFLNIPTKEDVAMLPPAEQQKVLDKVQALSPSAIASTFAVDALISAIPSHEEWKKWFQLRKCMDQNWKPKENPYLPMQLLASILSRSGEMLGDRVSSKIRAFAKYPSIRQNFDKFLPDISGLGECTIGPEGTVHIADLFGKPLEFLRNYTGTSPEEFLRNYTGKSGMFGPVKLKAESGHACLVP